MGSNGGRGEDGQTREASVRGGEGRREEGKSCEPNLRDACCLLRLTRGRGSSRVRDGESNTAAATAHTMPPTRKSGSAHSSKARSARQGEEQASASGSGTKAELRAARESNGGEEGMQSSVDEVHDLLEQFETQPQPLRAHVSDGKLKSLRSDWASMEGNFEIAYQLITQVAERLAEARSMEGIIDEDEVRQASRLCRSALPSCVLFYCAHRICKSSTWACEG